MLETMPIGAKDINFDFLLHRDQSYELITRPESDLELLPAISIEWEGYLKFKNIAYNVVGDMCTVRDPNLYQSTKKYLPVYEECDGVYKYTGKYYPKKIPTKESLEAAKVVYEEFVEYITEIQIIEQLRKELKEKLAIFIPKPTEWQLKKYNLMDKYKIFVYECGDYGYIIADYKKIKTLRRKGKKVSIKITVPSKRYAGLVIGKDRKNINPLIKMLGVEKIIVTY